MYQKRNKKKYGKQELYLIQFSDSLRITADYIELSEGTTLIEPQKRSLHGLTGETDESKLVLNDICIEDPAQGLLFTNMPNVEFKNITVDGECECEKVENLACDKSDFETVSTGFIAGLSCEELKEKLINATFCKLGQIVHTTANGAQERPVRLFFTLDSYSK